MAISVISSVAFINLGLYRLCLCLLILFLHWGVAITQIGEGGLDDLERNPGQ